jgi:hypothetical protein
LERGKNKKRGASAPLKHPVKLASLSKGEIKKGGGEAPLLKLIPLPISKGKGIKGIGF